MKKWITLILSFYLLFSAIVPCSYIDNCVEQTQQSTNKEQNKDCDNCSPFCLCSPAHNFTLNKIIFFEPLLPASNTLVYNEYQISFQYPYASSFFNPPRIG